LTDGMFDRTLELAWLALGDHRTPYVPVRSVGAPRGRRYALTRLVSAGFQLKGQSRFLEGY